MASTVHPGVQHAPAASTRVRTHPFSDARAEPAGEHAPHFVIAGPLRAGTTMLRLILNSHPSIGCVGEFEEAVSRARGVAGSDVWPDLGTYRAFLAQDRAALAKALVVDASIPSYPGLVRSLWDQLAARESKPVVGCCIHSRFDRVREIWPGTRFIYLSRDPRDVARSCVGMGWAGEPTGAVGKWLEPTRRWLALRETLDPADFVELRYEDLVANPEGELDRCCRLLGHGFDPAMLAFHESSTYEPLDPRLAEQWRRKMPARTAEIIDAACVGLMPRFGYAASVPDPRPASGLEAVRLRVANRLGRLRFRRERYGVGLMLAWAAVKRLPLDNPWRKRVKGRINAVDTRHLR
ncbi:MAG: sulfotransferase [Phycisphaerales bacterium]|nr:sulfotransferase [Planctomycetota bacterium]MCH8509674.1 sulfotransferase [Phycisphaerales bacterium]